MHRDTQCSFYLKTTQTSFQGSALGLNAVKSRKEREEEGRKQKRWLVKKAFSEQEVKTLAWVSYLLVSCVWTADEEPSGSSKALKHHMHMIL